jgi:hypothetical protein
MSESPCNLLPPAVKVRFRVVYSELADPGLGITIIKNASEKWGVLVPAGRWTLSGYKYLVKAQYESIGFDKNTQLIEAVFYEDNKWNKETNVYSFFDTAGKKVWESEKGMSASIDKFGNILVEAYGKFGLLGKDFRMAVKPEYKSLSSINENCLRIGSEDGMYGIIDRENQMLLEPVYHEIMKMTAEGKVIVRKSGENCQLFDLETRELMPLPYQKVRYASSNSYGAPVKESEHLLKAIADLRQIDEAFRYDYEEMVEYQGKWGIVEANGEPVIPLEYDYIDFLENPSYLKVCKGELNFTELEDEEGYLRTTLEPGKAKWGIVDLANRIVVPVEYDWIDEVGNTLWAVHKGGTVFYNDDYQEDYWAIRGSKLGVHNPDKLIIPVEYDTITLNWYRIRLKDRIEVGKLENGTEKQDLFTLEGKKIVTGDHSAGKTWK